jgi:hypothetical protein
MALENRRKEVDGNLEKVIPQYMAAVIAYKKSQGKPVYPDANSTLRVTYGTVSPYAPRDGIRSRARSPRWKASSRSTPARIRSMRRKAAEAVKAKRYGVFKDPVLGTVPVNFLSSADTTGGNSGSAVDEQARRAGWPELRFDLRVDHQGLVLRHAITRAIHVDIRYMLWVMKEVDHADNLLKEMTIKYPKK